MKYQEGGLAAATSPAPVDPIQGYLSLLAQQQSTSPEAQERAREILDQLMAEDTFAREEEILERFKETAEESRAALQDARQRVLAERFDPRQKWLAIAAAAGAPTRTGQFGETLGNVARGLAPVVAEESEFRRDQGDRLLQLDQALAGVDEGLLANEFKLAQMQREQFSALGREALKTLGKTTMGGARPQPTAGGKSRDQKMATTLNDWVTQGQADAVKSMSELTEAIDMMRKSDNISGPLLGLAPKWARDFAFPESGNVQDLVETTAQRSLKAVLGGQFGQREGEMLLARTFNPRLDESVNLKRAYRLLRMLEIATEQKNAALRHFEQYGTMEGFEGKTEWTIEDFELPPEMVKVRMQDGTIIEVDASWTRQQIEDFYRESRGDEEKPKFQEGGAVDINEWEQMDRQIAEPKDDSLGRDLALLVGSTVAGTGSGLGVEELGARLEELQSGFERPARGERLVAEAMEVGGVDPRQMATEVKRAQRMGVPELPLDVSGRTTTELGERALMAGGEEAERAIEMLGERHADSAERVGRQIEKSLRTPEFFELEERLTNKLYENSRPLYRKAYAENKIVDAPPFWGNMLQNKYGRQAIEQAMEFMEDIAQKPYGQQDAMGMVRKPSLEFLDQVKRGFDQLIRKEETHGPTPLGRHLRKQRSRLVAWLDNPDNVTPDYQKARKQYKGDLEVLEALDTGRREFHRMAPEALRREMVDMSYGEKYALRAGVAQRLYEMIYHPTTDMNSARKLIGSPDMRRRLELLFDKPREYRIFEAALQREMDLFEREKKTVRRSESGRTRRMTEDLLAMDDPLTAVKDKIGRGPLGRVIQLLPSFGRTRQTIELSEKEADDIIRILTTGEVDELDKLGERLSDVQQRGKTRRKRRGKAAAVGTAVGAALGALGILDGEDEPEEETVDIEEVE